MTSTKSTTRRRRSSAVIVLSIILALVSTFATVRARAEELGRSPWFPLVEPAQGAQETFELNSLGLIRVGGEEWRVFRGKYRSSVKRHDFFVTVGRPDLAARESSRRTAENAFYYGGLGTAVVGGALLFAHLRTGGFDPPPAFGGGVLAAGVVAVFVSRAFSGPALPADEAEGLAIRYNERLRDQLESGGTSSVVAAREGSRVLPYMAPGGAGVVASATF